jgi:hypothetical protein
VRWPHVGVANVHIDKSAQAQAQGLPCHIFLSRTSHLFFLQRSQSSYSRNAVRKAWCDSILLVARSGGQKKGICLPTDMNGKLTLSPSPFCIVPTTSGHVPYNHRGATNIACSTVSRAYPHNRPVQLAHRHTHFRRRILSNLALCLWCGASPARTPLGSYL